MTENLHVQGYLAYWDALRQRHPKLLIDSCASGGRRNDLETMRRAVPLHPTDYNYGHLAAKQAFHQSLFQWIPYFGSNTVPVDTVDAYAHPQRPRDERRAGLRHAAQETWTTRCCGNSPGRPAGSPRTTTATTTR